MIWINFLGPCYRMPPQTDSAKRTRICKINESLAGEKLRVAGKFVRSLKYTIWDFWLICRVFFYDVVTGFIVLVDKANGLVVDMSEALDGQSRLWASERLSVIMVIGYLELCSVGRFLFLPLPIVLIIGLRHLFLCSQPRPIYHRFG